MTMPPKPLTPEVVSRTMFAQNENDKWFWQTKSLTNEVIAEGSEVYNSLREAIKGFFEFQNAPYEPFGMWPSNFGPLKMLPENNYQINKYLSQGN